jgi:hypothetical protein
MVPEVIGFVVHQHKSRANDVVTGSDFHVVLVALPHKRAGVDIDHCVGGTVANDNVTGILAR